MADDRAFPLAEDFPPATRDDWLKLVDKTLAGAAFEDRLVSRTDDGVEINPLYTAADAEAHPAPMPAPRAGERPWEVRVLINHPDQTTANAWLLKDLEGGAASAAVRIDPTGRNGVAVGSAEALSRVLDDVVLELAPIALDAAFLGPQAANWLGAAAKSSPGALLEFHLDPLGALAETGTSDGPIEAHLVAAATAAVRLSESYPKAGLFLASGRVVHEAGGSEALELGFAAASAVAYAKALVHAGLPLADAFARITLGLAADGEYFLTATKLRAARMIWARITAACGVDPPARIEARSSRRMLAARDPWTNMLRLTCAGFGAAVGGADAIVLGHFTDALGLPTGFGRRQSRNIQLVLMEEANIGRVEDPASGAWFLESLTVELARLGWAVFQEIEADGGVAAALASGWIARRAASNLESKRIGATGDGLGQIVGVTIYPNAAGRPVEIETADPVAFAVTAPKTRLPGPDSTGMPLTAMRIAEPFEAAP